MFPGDDILSIYLLSKSEHEVLVMDVLRHLHDYELTTDIEKCEFHKELVEFLGYIIPALSIQMANNKVKIILEWKCDRAYGLRAVPSRNKDSTKE